jgi:hypothetical protein
LAIVFKVTTKRGRYPHTDDGVEVRQIFHFLEAISDPDHPEHEELLEWVGGTFDSEAFDCAAVNEALRGR